MAWYRLLIFSSSMKLIGGAYLQATSQMHALSQGVSKGITAGNLAIAQSIDNQHVPDPTMTNRRLNHAEIVNYVDESKAWDLESNTLQPHPR